MATVEQYKEIVDSLVKQYNLAKDQLHEYIIGLFVPGTRTEVARLIYDAETFNIGVSFHIGLVPTDAIQFYEHLRSLSPDVVLTEAYFQDAQGQTFLGIDAQIMMENDRQNKIVSAMKQPTDDQKRQEAEWQAKKGKVTFH